MSEQFDAGCNTHYLSMDTGCPLPQMQVIQRPESDVPVSDDWFLALALGKTDSQLLWCTHFWSFKASTTPVSFFQTVFFRIGEQRGQGNTWTTVCVGTMARVRLLLMVPLFRYVQKWLHLYCMTRRILSFLNYCPPPTLWVICLFIHNLSCGYIFVSSVWELWSLIHAGFTLSIPLLAERPRPLFPTD